MAKRKPPKRRPRNRATLDKQTALIAAYAICPSIKAAAAAAGVNRDTHYNWLRSDEAYRNAFAKGHDEIAQGLEYEAVRRAVEGVESAMYYRGKPVKTGGRRGRQVYEIEYSDTLLIALLKRFRPALYREHTMTEITGSIDLGERIHAARRRVLEMRKNDDSRATG